MTKKQADWLFGKGFDLDRYARASHADRRTLLIEWAYKYEGLYRRQSIGFIANIPRLMDYLDNMVSEQDREVFSRLDSLRRDIAGAGTWRELERTRSRLEALELPSRHDENRETLVTDASSRMVDVEASIRLDSIRSRLHETGLIRDPTLATEALSDLHSATTSLVLPEKMEPERRELLREIEERERR